MVEIRIAASQKDIQGILDLQLANHKSMVSADDAISQGFLTVLHTQELLEKMVKNEPQIIAVLDDKVVGYALAQPKGMRNDITALIPMFDLFDSLHFQGYSLKDIPYIVMGQVCVGAVCRGQGVFDRLYYGLRDALSDRYPFILTEIATRNTRSRKAHARVGFEDIHIYHDAKENEEWAIVGWKW